MKNLRLVTAAVITLGAAAPAAAADLPARPAPYTKAPAVVAAAYDWSGFYIGINGGGGFSHNAGILTMGWIFPPPQKVVTMRLGPRSAAKLAIAGRTPTGFSV